MMSRFFHGSFKDGSFVTVVFIRASLVSYATFVLSLFVLQLSFITKICISFLTPLNATFIQ